MLVEIIASLWYFLLLSLVTNDVSEDNVLCETWLYRLCRCEEHTRFIKFTRVHRGEYRCSCIVSVCRNEIYTEGNWIVAISWKRWTVSRSATVERRASLWQATAAAASGLDVGRWSGNAFSGMLFQSIHISVLTFYGIPVRETAAQ